MDKRLTKCLREARGDRAQAFAPMRQGQSKFVRQRRRDPADAIWELGKVSRGKDAVFQHVEQKGVYVRSYRFHRVEREGLAR